MNMTPLEKLGMFALAIILLVSIIIPDAYLIMFLPVGFLLYFCLSIISFTRKRKKYGIIFLILALVLPVIGFSYCLTTFSLNTQ